MRRMRLHVPFLEDPSKDGRLAAVSASSRMKRQRASEWELAAAVDLFTLRFLFGDIPEAWDSKRVVLGGLLRISTARWRHGVARSMVDQRRDSGE